MTADETGNGADATGETKSPEEIRADPAPNAAPTAARLGPDARSLELN